MELDMHLKMKTSLGDIVLQLDGAKAPISTANFLNYVDKGHYDGTIFHRVIPTFMIQGGGFTPDMRQKATDKPIKNEWKNGLKNSRGSIAMARTSDPDSGTCQFFINVKDNTFLDQPNDGAAYAVFGRVISGMDIVDKIKNVPTAMKNGMGDVPRTPVVIETVSRMTDEEVAGIKS
jgi:peptidyl-prolyl cis-trans isomerase A (cyclophilin A)